MKKIISLRTVEFMQNGLVGGLWIIFGIIKVFSINENLDILANILLLIASIGSFIPYFIKTEIEDERAFNNKIKARAISCELVTIVIFSFMAITVFKDSLIINFKLIMPFLVGGIMILKFILFVIYESIGE